MEDRAKIEKGNFEEETKQEVKDSIFTIFLKWLVYTLFF